MGSKRMTVGRRITIGFAIMVILLAALGTSSFLGVSDIVGNGEQVIEGNKLDGLLAQKEVDHLNWSEKVNELLTNEKITELDVQLDPHKCGLGEWYYSDQRKQAEELVPTLAPIFQAIEAPHKALHQSAGKIKEIFRQPHPGLSLELSNRLNDHIQWAANVYKGVAVEAGGIALAKTRIKNSVECTLSILDKEATEGGAFNLMEQKSQVARTLSGVKFGSDNKDYLMVLDNDGTMMSHPDSTLAGQNVFLIQDEKGNPILMDLIKEAQKKEKGFALVNWPALGDEKPGLKLVYYHYFAPWKWTLAAGTFLNQDNKLLMQRVEKLAAGEPFTLGVQLDPQLCAFGKFLEDPAILKIESQFPEFKAAMNEVRIPHEILHASAAKIENLIRAEEIAKAIDVFDAETIPALELVKKYLGEAIAAEERIQKGFNEAAHIYSDETMNNLNKVRGLLHEMRTEVKKNIMSDVVMIDSAQATQIRVTILAISSIILGILAAFLIRRSLIRDLLKMADGIGRNSFQVSTASDQVSRTSNQLAEGASEQAASLEETSSSMEEMSSMTNQNADNARKADDLMKRTSSVVGDAENTMREMMGAMQDISGMGEKIGQIIKTINEIAFQTNLLALNAAVEAARAGEAGQGFAVVADEVRNLALRASDAAKNTADLIEGTTQKIKHGRDLADHATQAFNQVSEQAKTAGALIGEIASASNEQAEGISQINQAISQLDSVTQQNAAAAEESAAAAAELNDQADNLMALTEQLLELMGKKSSGTQRQAASPPRLEYNRKTTQTKAAVGLLQGPSK